MHFTRPFHSIVQREWKEPTKCLRESHREEPLFRLFAGELPVLCKIGLDLGLDGLPSERVRFGV
jgi:hypothetical protein